MSIVTRFGFLASLGINKANRHGILYVYIFASHYTHAYFPRLNIPTAKEKKDETLTIAATGDTVPITASDAVCNPY
jgi:hypothetical protein